MKLARAHPRLFWSTESGLTGLLVFFLGYLVVVNSLGYFSLGRLLARLFFSFIIVAGVITTFKQRWLHGFALVLAVAILALTWVEEIRPGLALTTLNAGLVLIYLGFLLALVGVQVFGEGPVTAHRIRGAILVYLLLGVIWAFLYQVVALSIPQAFHLPEGAALNDPEALQRQFTYFSFITLTTTGYGDITPIHPVAKMLAMFEALAGQLFLAITIVRLVALAVMHKKDNPAGLDLKQMRSKHMNLYRNVRSAGFSACFLAAACLAVGLLMGCRGEKPAGPAAPPVEVAEVVVKDVPIVREWVGTTDGLVNAKINAQVQGYLIKQNYREGSLVKKGQVLFEIDPRPFEATLAHAKGELAIAEGQLYTAKANLEKIRPLAAVNAVSKKDLDDAIGREASARAAVQSAKAAVRKAEIDLSFTKITSPIEGIAGLAKAQLGDLVGNPGGPELTTVSTLNPIKVYIPISEQEYMHFSRTAETRKQAGQEEPVLELVLADGRVFPHKGRVFFADRQVDERTGTIKVAAIFPNPGNYLRPGQFAKVRALIETQEGALLVPQRAVTELQGRYQVAVVSADNKVELRWVKVGERAGSLWVVEEGLKPGERVIVEGVQKVRAGMAVTAKPFQESAAGAGPTPTSEKQPR